MREKMNCCDKEHKTNVDQYPSYNNSSRSKEIERVPLVRLVTVTEENLRSFKKLNQSILPICYSDNIYKQIVKHSINDPLKLTQLALYEKNDKLSSPESVRIEVFAGLMCCWLVDIDHGYTFKIPPYRVEKPELEKVYPTKNNVIQETGKNKSLYILTFGCLPLYRRRGIGTKLMQHLTDKISESNNQIHSIFLHVQISNEEAIAFYKKFGFEIVKEVENYYHRITPTNAYILEKQLNI